MHRARFQASGAYLATRNGQVMLWDLRTFRCVHSGKHPLPPNADPNVNPFPESGRGVH